MKLSKVDCSRGAPMGRGSKHLEGDIGAAKFHLQAVPLDSGGYDSGGAYWGLREPVKVTVDNTPPGAKGKALHTYMATPRLYWYWWNGNKPSAAKPVLIEGFIDAFNREDAKAQIRALYPQAVFYR